MHSPGRDHASELLDHRATQTGKSNYWKVWSWRDIGPLVGRDIIRHRGRKM